MKVDVPEIEISERVVLDPSVTAVIVVDMQNDFVHEKGRLFVPDAVKTIEPIRRLLGKSRRHGVRIFYTQDTHWSGDPEFGLWGKHVEFGSWGWRIIDELKPSENDIVVVKTRYDGFYGTPLDDLLRSYGIENLVLTGTVANICVLHTAASAGLRWYKIYLPMDAISALTEFDYYLTLRQVSWLYRGTIVRSVEGIVFE